MSRSVTRGSNNEIFIIHDKSGNISAILSFDAYSRIPAHLQHCIRKLADYEDTGLEPGEIV